jgi:hypothetical protein
VNDNNGNKSSWETAAKFIAAVATLLGAIVAVINLIPTGSPHPPHFKVDYLYHPAGQDKLRPLTEGSKLHSGDQYKVWFTVEQDSYVYIFQLDSSQTIYRLFPLEDFQGVTVNQTNPVQTGRQYQLPAQDQAFTLNRQVGQEKIYFLGFRERNETLEKLYDDFQQARQQQRVAQAEERQAALLKRLQQGSPAAVPILTFLHLE